MSRKIWNLIPYDKQKASALAEECGADDFAVLLMLSRGIDTAEKINTFISASEGELSSPFLLKDMEKAATRIKKAIAQGEKIYVYGDYDADGVTSTALLYSYLEAAGADVHYHIPSRLTEGYGLSMSAAEKIAAEGTDLVITVDNGIASFEEAEYFRDNGIDFIVTDHHKVGEQLPDAYAVINPHRDDDTSPEENLAGVGVAMKLCTALEDGDYDTILEEYGDIAAIGTIADIVPLTNENRIIVAKGLKALEYTCRPGLIGLMKSIGCSAPVCSSKISFGIAPRINAVGRIGSADTALELLLTEDENRANELVDLVNDANSQRQNIESDIIKEIEESVEADPEFSKRHVLVAAGRNWHVGIIGIAASRLVDKYSKPALIISTDDNGNSRGSGRSLAGLSLYDALNYCSDLLIQFGGHTLAAGFSIEEKNIDKFRDKINEYAAALPPFYPSIDIDCRLNPANMSIGILDSLAVLEPYGAMNPVPVFGLFNMKIISIKPIGSNRHLRLSLSKNSAHLNVVYFGCPPDDFPYMPGDAVDLAVKIDKNEYMGEINLSIQLRDIRPAGTDDTKLFRSIDTYKRFMNGEKLSDAEKRLICPDRSLLCDVFRYIRRNRSWRFSAEVLTMRVNRPAESTGAVMTALTALTETGILRECGEEYTLTDFKGKADLASCDILKNLGYRD